MRAWLWFFVKLAVLVAAALWLAGQTGRLEIEWRGWLVETRYIGLFLALLGALMVAGALGWAWLGGAARMPGSLIRLHRAARRERGHRALGRGMVAVAAGDGEGAGRLAHKARRLLDEPPLTLLLSAQAAQLKGDDGEARRYFEAMAARDETAFLGLRGLLAQALEAGDGPRALDLARRAQRVQPRSAWVAHMRIQLETDSLARADLPPEAEAWEMAEAAIREAGRAGALEAARRRRHLAALALGRAEAARRAGDLAAAQGYARQAVKQRPDFPPAIAGLAAIEREAGQSRAARRALEKGWARAPHPDLARQWSALAPEGQREGAAHLDWLARLRAINADRGEADLAVARAALAQGLIDEARAPVERAIAAAPHRGSLRLAARLEAESGAPARIVRAALDRCLDAPPAPVWLCDACGARLQSWQMHCPDCHSFDSLDWPSPPAEAPAAEILPPDRPASASTAATPPRAAAAS